MATNTVGIDKIQSYVTESISIFCISKHTLPISTNPDYIL